MDNSTWIDWLEATLPTPPEKYSVDELTLVSAMSVFVLHTMYIYDHKCCWEKPKEQRMIVLLLLIPPIQAVVSAYLHFALPPDTLFIVLDSIKQCYTALIFPLFLSLLFTYLQLNDPTLSSIYVRVIIGNRQITHFYPVTLIQPASVYININNLKFFEYSTWQFVVIRLVCSLAMIVFQLLGMYPVWLSCAFFVILNLSFFLAFYTVYVFYQAFTDDFRLHIYYKYFFFRMIVFACFFQGAVISLVKETGIIQADLQNILVTVGMMLLILPSRVAFRVGDSDPILPVVQPVCYYS